MELRSSGRRKYISTAAREDSTAMNMATKLNSPRRVRKLLRSERILSTYLHLLVSRDLTVRKTKRAMKLR
jgi:hypothetical protein